MTNYANLGGAGTNVAVTRIFDQKSTNTTKTAIINSIVGSTNNIVKYTRGFIVRNNVFLNCIEISQRSNADAAIAAFKYTSHTNNMPSIQALKAGIFTGFTTYSLPGGPATYNPDTNMLSTTSIGSYIYGSISTHLPGGQNYIISPTSVALNTLGTNRDTMFYKYNSGTQNGGVWVNSLASTTNGIRTSTFPISAVTPWGYILASSTYTKTPPDLTRLYICGFYSVEISNAILTNYNTYLTGLFV